MEKAYETYVTYEAKCKELGIPPVAKLEEFMYSEELIQIRFFEEMVRAMAMSRGLTLVPSEVTAAVDQIFERRLEVAKALGKEVADILYP